MSSLTQIAISGMDPDDVEDLAKYLPSSELIRESPSLSQTEKGQLVSLIVFAITAASLKGLVAYLLARGNRYSYEQEIELRNSDGTSSIKRIRVTGGSSAEIKENVVKQLTAFGFRSLLSESDSADHD